MKRRTFIKTTAAAGAGAFVLPRFSIGQPGPSANSKLNIAMIGAGGIAGMAFGGTKGENIVALCDVDSGKLGDHAEKFPEITNAKAFTDFRVMLDKVGKELDGVCINTPDHTHFAATIAAMERGLHVCTQKPLTHNIWEARTLHKAKAKYKVITNMGNQGHTYDGIRRMRRWVEADEISGGNDMQYPAHVRVRWEFEARDDKPPCSLTWYSGTAVARLREPESWGWGEKLPGKGTLFFGEKQTGFTDERSNNPKLTDREAMIAFKEAGYPAETYPRVPGGGPHGEWVRAIKGEGPEPGANFDYAAPMTEVGLLGALAQRFGGRIEWDAKTMKITNRPALNAYLKEPSRDGWAFGEEV